jgi:hypothetical protein
MKGVYMYKQIIMLLVVLTLFSACKNNAKKAETPAPITKETHRIVYFLGGDIETSGSSVHANAFVPEDMLAEIHRGMNVVIRSSGNSDNLMHGEVISIDPEIEAKSKTALAQIRISDPLNSLRDGMIVLIGREL